MKRVYKVSDQDLEEMATAKRLARKYNNVDPGNRKRQHKILTALLRKIGDNAVVTPPFYCDYGCNIEIGNDFFSNFNLVILDCAKVTIGNNVFIGPNVGIYAATHPIHHERRNDKEYWALPIKIGDNVWIGGNVVINPGVTIGHNVVVGAGSVVTKDIPDGVLAYGNPCRVIRTISPDE